jgi:CRAL/TRIO domain
LQVKVWYNNSHHSDIVPLHVTTAENYKIIILRLISDDFGNLNFDDVIKAFFMMSDVRLITPDKTTLTDGEIPIFDMARVSYRHLTKIVLSTLRLYLKYTQEAHPVRVRHLHIVNCNPIIDKIIYLIKPFVRTENFNMIHFHTPGSQTLFKFIDKEYLPSDYGGDAGPVEVQKRAWIERMEKHR